MKMLADDRMTRQLETWITETDFKQISQLGFNSVRLPIGYWNVIVDPYKWFAPYDYRTSLKYIDKAFAWALKYNLSVLLDLHGGPGSQVQHHSIHPINASYDDNLSPYHINSSSEPILSL